MLYKMEQESRNKFACPTMHAKPHLHVLLAVERYRNLNETRDPPNSDSDATDVESLHAQVYDRDHRDAAATCRDYIPREVPFPTAICLSDPAHAQSADEFFSPDQYSSEAFEDMLEAYEDTAYQEGTNGPVDGVFAKFANVNGTLGPDQSPHYLETGEVEQLAEVVLVTTSLGSIKRQFFQSRRAQHLLDCKNLVYYLIDANRDVSSAMNLKDRELFDDWVRQGRLTVGKVDGVDRVLLPQLIVDGIVLGDDVVLQDLEDDGDLDYIVARLVCPRCKCEKDPALSKCGHCSMEYTSIIPQEYLDDGTVQRIYQGQPYD